MTPAQQYTSSGLSGQKFYQFEMIKKMWLINLGLDFIKENPTMTNKLFGCDRQKVMWWMKTFLWMMAAKCPTGEEWCSARWRKGRWRSRPQTWQSGRRASPWTRSRRGRPQNRDRGSRGIWRAWERRERRKTARGTAPPLSPGWRGSGPGWSAVCWAALNRQRDWIWPSVSSRLVSTRALKWKHEIVARSLPTVLPQCPVRQNLV